ncbi:E3 ubiquitin-protein ligase RNF170 [Patella vulgata]|uniref:E3 ubiquitin-protein ligase RNF170 n=1 Tax=Patella vulgata TaxID=6465 RepID=UPI00218076E3|nr:E3 ubiquitin-protein ligase RNF170 [Patella vulgata]
MSGYYLRKTNLIEGVGNEILYGFAAFLGILIPLIYFVWKIQNEERSNNIHPDSAINVAATREHLSARTPSRARRDHNNQFTCPICLGDAVFASETNCGHVFCSSCFVAYWEHGHWLGGVKCPVCRQAVTIMLFNFTEEEVQTPSAERTLIQGAINHYNARFSGEPRPFLDYVRDLPTLLRHAFSEFFTVGGLLWMFRLRVVMCCIAALLYFISPFDIIPESMFGLLGFLDDIFIILLLAIYVSLIYRRVVENRGRPTADNGTAL